MRECTTNRARRVAGAVCASGMFSALLAQAEVKLPAIFQSHMVLQQQKSVPIWGWAEPDERVTVACAGQTTAATAGRDGTWSVKLDPMAAGGPHRMTVSASNAVTIEDVLIGEVWLCSGQSNMAMSVGAASNAAAEAAAASFPELRMITVSRQAAAEPQQDCTTAGWKVCSPDTVKSFSATAYFFGRHIHQHLNVPVGLINSSWGGTCVETWTSREALAKLECGRAMIAEWDQKAASYDAEAAQQAFQKRLEQWKVKQKQTKTDGKWIRRPRAPVPPAMNQNAPARLYNAMIAPLVPYAIRGAAWYQGERNCNSIADAYEYRDELPALIRCWRGVWQQGDFPFLYVQLPNFGGKSADALALNRESMMLALATPNTGMAITIDIGDTKDIHPKNKQDVGKRLGLAARKIAYGEDVVHSGPVYRALRINAAALVLEFDSVGSGLVARDGELREFTLAGDDRTFVPAVATIQGNTIVVSSPDVPKPAAARYAWTNDPQCNLYNQEGLPASPFRTDTWPIPGQDRNAE